MNKIVWQFYPKSMNATNELLEAIKIFDNHFDEINSKQFVLHSNDVLAKVSQDLIVKGYLVETGKKENEKIRVPVLYGQNGIFEKSFDADAYNEKLHIVIEVEAGRALTNYQFLKDLFEACVMDEVEYLVIAVRRKYRKSPDFDNINNFMNTLYSSNRLTLPLKGVLILGY